MSCEQKGSSGVISRRGTVQTLPDGPVFAVIEPLNSDVIQPAQRGNKAAPGSNAEQQDSALLKTLDI